MSMSGTLASTLIQLIRNWRLDAWMTVRYCRSLGMKASMLKSELAVTMSCAAGGRGRHSQTPAWQQLALQRCPQLRFC